MHFHTIALKNGTWPAPIVKRKTAYELRFIELVHPIEPGARPYDDKGYQESGRYGIDQLTARRRGNGGRLRLNASRGINAKPASILVAMESASP